MSRSYFMRYSCIRIALLSIATASYISCSDNEPSGSKGEGQGAAVEIAPGINSMHSGFLLAETLLRNQNIRNAIIIGKAGIPLCARLPDVSFIGFSQSNKLSKGCTNYKTHSEELLKSKLSEFNFAEPFAVIALDINIKDGVLLQDNPFLKESLNAAALVVLESSLTNALHHAQLLELAELTRLDANKSQKVNVRFTLNQNKLAYKDRARELLTFDKVPVVQAQCPAQEANRWKYLWQNPSLNSRHLIASSFIKENGIKTIVEIGGYCTPLCRFDPDIKYINIDPYVDGITNECKNAQLIKKSFETLHLQDLGIEKPFALVAIGIGWDKEGMRNDPQRIAKDRFLNEVISEATVLVAEATYQTKWTREQANAFESIAAKNSFKKVVDVEIDVQGKRPMNLVHNRHLRLFKR